MYDRRNTQGLRLCNPLSFFLRQITQTLAVIIVTSLMLSLAGHLLIVNYWVYPLFYICQLKEFIKRPNSSYLQICSSVLQILSSSLRIAMQVLICQLTQIIQLKKSYQTLAEIPKVPCQEDISNNIGSNVFCLFYGGIKDHVRKQTSGQTCVPQSDPSGFV